MHGLRLILRMEIHEVHIFSDSLNTVRMINGEIDKSPEVSHWITTTQDLCQSLQTISLSYISRDKNRRADGLAKDVLMHQNSMLWLDNFPQ